MHKFLRFYNALLGILIVAATISLYLILTKTDPAADKLYIALFYATVFVLFSSLSTLVSYHLRRIFGQRELAILHLKISCREGCLLGILAVLMLVLQANRLLSLLNASFLSIAFIFLESFFLVHDKQS